MSRFRAPVRARLELVQLLHLRIVDGVGEVVRIHLPYIGFAAFIIEAFHLVLARLALWPEPQLVCFVIGR